MLIGQTVDNIKTGHDISDLQDGSSKVQHVISASHC